MAKTQDAKTLERVYNVPLRKEYRKGPRWKRTKKAVRALREFLTKHMRSENVKLGKELNEELWKHGIRNPPHHVKVTATKDEKGVVKAELFGVEKKTKEEKKTPMKKEEKRETAEEKPTAEKVEEKKLGKERA